MKKIKARMNKIWGGIVKFVNSPNFTNVCDSVGLFFYITMLFTGFTVEGILAVLILLITATRAEARLAHREVRKHMEKDYTLTLASDGITPEELANTLFRACEQRKYKEGSL